MKSLFNKPLIWIILFIAAGASLFFIYNYFSRAFPIVNLDLKMDRAQALEKAKQLATQFSIGPKEYHQATAFDVDKDVQHFVELEAGGKQAFAQMLQEPYYAPYQWQVRHFKEFEKHEVQFRFKSDGTPYGFTEFISESLPGAALERAQAQEIAQQQAQQHWFVALKEYTLVEASKEAHPSGRVDHTFVYERPTIRIGDAMYRLRLVVSGDKLTEVMHYIKIPEAFTRKYSELRSANTSLAAGAQMLMMLLYMFCGCIIGLFLLARKGYVIWHQPLRWGLLIAFLHALVTINDLPLAWMQYDTALSPTGFLFSQAMGIVYQFIYFVAFYTLAIAAGETFTRAAFGSHIQFWKSWSPSVGSSTAMLGRTLGGYLLIPFDFMYVIIFYIIATTFFGWWIPSGALINPNILASYLPWLSPLVLSLGAGFMEECLFRAVPIGGAALLGKRFGNPKLWMIIGFIVQALIFGAAHANYPTQPAYSRLVELFLFSIWGGLIYLYFGLIPSIIYHFAYDVVWMALPIFISTAQGIWLHQGIIIIVTLLPLWIILYRAYQARGWHALSSTYLNNHWKPLPYQEQPAPSRAELIPPALSKRFPLFLGICLAVGSILWLSFARFASDAPALPITKTQALEVANAALHTKTIQLPAHWQALTTISGSYNANDESQHKFIWQEAGQDIYNSLLGTYLIPPAWYIRFASFTGPVADRAEEYQLLIRNNEYPYRFSHILPEARAGAQLTEQEARTIARQAIEKQLHIPESQLQEICAQAKKHLQRNDWTLIFADKKYPESVSSEKKDSVGQARIEVEITGDQVTDIHRYIHVPENWERKATNQQNFLKIIQFFCSLLLYALLCISLLFAFKTARHVTFISWQVAWYCGFFYLLYLVCLLNGLPSMVALFNTSEPYYNQLFTNMSSVLVFNIVKAGILSILFIILTQWYKPWKPLRVGLTLIAGVAFGLLLSAYTGLLNYLVHTSMPLWADYSYLGNYSPLLALITQTVRSYLNVILLLLAFSVCMDYLFNTLKRPWLALLSSFIFTLSITGMFSIESLTVIVICSLIAGILLWLFYRLVLHYDTSIIPIATATFIIGNLLQQAFFAAYPFAVLHNLIASGVILVLAYFLTKGIRNVR